MIKCYLDILSSSIACVLDSTCITFARPGQVGNLEGPLAAAESRSHFGAWCIVSSPLILGMDMTNESTMASVWPYISNREAIAVNQHWVGDPGRLLTTPLAAAPTIEIFAKLQPAGAVALLAINTATTDFNISSNADGAVGAALGVDVDLAAVLGAQYPGLKTFCHTSCEIYDIWAQKTLGKTVKGVWKIGGLQEHASAFVLITPPTATSGNASYEQSTVDATKAT